MEQLLETISLDSEENNELLFKVKIEGTDPAPAKVRLVCESDDLSFMFKGQPIGDDTVSFSIPTMKDKIKEGIYHSKIEVLVENRYFSPVQFQINFKKTVKVVAESLNQVQRKQPQEIKISAAQVVKPEQVVQASVVEQKPVPQITQPVVKKKTLREQFVKQQLNEEEILAAAQNFVTKFRKNK